MNHLTKINANKSKSVKSKKSKQTPFLLYGSGCSADEVTIEG